MPSQKRDNRRPCRCFLRCLTSGLRFAAGCAIMTETIPREMTMALSDILASDEFELRALGRMRLVVRRDGGDAIAQALATGEGCTPLDRGERGSLRRFAWRPDRSGLVRVCHRGGFVSLFLKDSYILENRPGNEFVVHRRVEQTGLPVPKALGVLWERRGLRLRGALATEWLPGEHLLAWLAGQEPGSPERYRMMEKVGALVRNMHNVGVWHADLQVKNIMLVDALPHLIDFDRSRAGKAPGRLARSRNLLRFRRSLQKQGMEDACFKAFMAGYGDPQGAEIPVWLDGLYRLRGVFSEAMQGLKR